MTPVRTIHAGILVFFLVFELGAAAVFAELQTKEGPSSQNELAQPGAAQGGLEKSGKTSVLPSVTDTGGPVLPQTAQQWADFYQTDPSETFAKALWNAVIKSNPFAKNVGESVSGYVKDRQMQLEQQQLLEQFYLSCRRLLGPLRLSSADYRELIAKLEQHYIDDGQKGQPQLDLKTFRDLSNLVKLEHADLLRRRAKDGEFPEYYPSGVMKTRWRFKEGKPEGAVVTYYESGDILYIDHYREGEKISRRKYDREGKMEFEQVYDYGPVIAAVPQTVPEQPADPS